MHGSHTLTERLSPFSPSNPCDPHSYLEGVRANLLAGGDNCSRSIYIGALLAAEVRGPRRTKPHMREGLAPGTRLASAGTGAFLQAVQAGLTLRPRLADGARRHFVVRPA